MITILTKTVASMVTTIALVLMIMVKTIKKNDDSEVITVSYLAGRRLETGRGPLLNRPSCPLGDPI